MKHPPADGCGTFAIFSCHACKLAADGVALCAAAVYPPTATTTPSTVAPTKPSIVRRFRVDLLICSTSLSAGGDVAGYKQKRVDGYR
ncbi:hypothetical protein [Plantactinospora sp. KBS50]|uniref:hypothetical protein n=1 Tax=Plantactinospora sp. KBS50 TaxID=2024580 RepID=UPI000BAB0F96|nr:hypothetical protein [Plantactinospora sp. KBS50]ASW55206.1 hypothetical protein CIK06_15030 [Plantactinospora sp. KBS50]